MTLLYFFPRYFARSHLPRIPTKLVHRPLYHLCSMSSHPATIKAIQVTAYGGPEVLTVGMNV